MTATPAKCPIELRRRARDPVPARHRQIADQLWASEERQPIFEGLFPHEMDASEFTLLQSKLQPLFKHARAIWLCRDTPPGTANPPRWFLDVQAYDSWFMRVVGKLTGEEHINASVCIRLLERLQARLHIYLEVRFVRPNEQIPAHCTNGSLIAQDGLCQSASEPNLGINRAEESGTSSRRPAPDPRWKPTSRQPQTTAVRLLQRLS